MSAIDIQPKNTRKWQDFMHFHEQHPEVYQFFNRLVREVKSKGFDRIGAKLIIERIRWECYVEKKDRDYKINNNHFPYYARMFIFNNPDFDGFFQFRKLKE